MLLIAFLTDRRCEGIQCFGDCERNVCVLSLMSFKQMVVAMDDHSVTAYI